MVFIGIKVTKFSIRNQVTPLGIQIKDGNGFLNSSKVSLNKRLEGTLNMKC